VDEESFPRNVAARPGGVRAGRCPPPRCVPEPHHISTTVWYPGDAARTEPRSIPFLYIKTCAHGIPIDRTPETLAGLREANGQAEECPCKTDSGGWWIQCDLCAQWYHGPCQKLKKAQQESDERYAYAFVKPGQG
jgi:hypothetical protein